jgi:hypothetical protein
LSIAALKVLGTKVVYLGLIWLFTAIAIPLAALLATVLVASIVCFCFPSYTTFIRSRFITVVLILAGIGAIFHGAIFNKLHQAVNRDVPPTECKLYVAGFRELKAIYSMQSKDQFLSWCNSDHRNLREVSLEDMERFEFAIKADQLALDFEYFTSFAASRHGAWRVYYVEPEALIYICYNAL